MKRGLRSILDLVLRLTLALGLLCSPLAQPFAMASLATSAPQENASACPHHAKQEQPAPGKCCFKKGAACHCAMTVALPSPPLPMAVAPESSRPVSVVHFRASALPAQEPPPPRR